MKQSAYIKLTYLLLGLYTLGIILYNWFLWDSEYLPETGHSFFLWNALALFFNMFITGLEGLFLLSVPLGLIVIVTSIIKEKNPRFGIIASSWLAGLIVCVFMMPSFLDRMASHYESHHQDLRELRLYAEDVLDADCSLRLEINRKGAVKMFACAAAGENLKWYDGDYYTAMCTIGLTQNELDSLVTLLQETDCIGLYICPTEVFSVLFRRPGVLGGYDYFLFDEPMSAKNWNQYIDSYSHVPYCDTVAFAYGGPAFGTDDIPTRMKQRFMKKHQIESIEVLRP